MIFKLQPGHVPIFFLSICLIFTGLSKFVMADELSASFEVLGIERANSPKIMHYNSKIIKNRAVSQAAGFVSWGYLHNVRLAEGEKFIAAATFLINKKFRTDRPYGTLEIVRHHPDGRAEIVSQLAINPNWFTKGFGRVKVVDTEYTAPSTDQYKLEVRVYAHQVGLSHRSFMVFKGHNIHAESHNGPDTKLSDAKFRAGFVTFSAFDGNGLPAEFFAWTNRNGFKASEAQGMGHGGVLVKPHYLDFDLKAHNPDRKATLFIVHENLQSPSFEGAVKIMADAIERAQDVVTDAKHFWGVVQAAAVLL